jgi:GT2 family glycosyltransferase/MoaA/NifB/PqqE/SkfB family radical SAM enzyme
VTPAAPLTPPDPGVTRGLQASRPAPAGGGNLAAAPTPRVLWVELTSKCPFDCVFCSRELRRGAGQHLPFALYENLLGSLVDVRTLVLNYSGESTVYPDLIPAIRAARERGAWVELVSAFASVPPGLVRELAGSGLSRLTVSMHTADAAQFSDIYRYSSLAALEARLRELMSSSPRPIVDFGFVAMAANLDQLGPVGSVAREMGILDVLIFPVMRRDPIAAEFHGELRRSGQPKAEFRRRVGAAVAAAEARNPGVRFTVCTPGFDGVAPRLGAVPLPYHWPLPEGALIHSCEQNPFETAHVLSSGDVVPCEVLDRRVMGNLHEHSIGEIWNSETYRRFRASYRAGEIPECRTCAWKRAYLPAPLLSDILASRGWNSQLLYGWHPPVDGDIIWSTQRAAALLRPRRDSRTLHVSGMLPPGQEGRPNHLAVSCNGRQLGVVENPWGETIPFGLDFPVDDPAAEWLLEFRARFSFRPSEHGIGTDHRDLGFALVLVTSKPPQRPVNPGAVERLRRLICRVDRVARWRKRSPIRFPAAPPGISVVIPERDNPAELSRCLAAVERAACNTGEPVETIVVVNGSCRKSYEALGRYARFLFRARPLGFSSAVRCGLRAARYGWVYLLNNDVELDHEALRALLTLRSADVFSIASQIFLRDTTRYREETNLTAFRIENGLATVHDLIPSSAEPVECFYAGGGASLFQRRVLARLLTRAYDPFYWEDVEWGWRARKLGYRTLFCPESVANHAQHATISRFFSPDEVESITNRNRLLFQLRNLTESGSTEELLAEISRLPPAEREGFCRPGVLAGVAASRLWNLKAPLRDGQILSGAG